MYRREFLKIAGIAAVTGLGGIAKAFGLDDGRSRDEVRKRPNFVFFLIDDLGWTDLGCYGSPFYETPNIDRLAAQGMRFTDAYAACPVCSPTRASIMTGKYPARLGITDWIGAPQKPTAYRDRLPLEEVTIAEALQEAGYATGYVGKWHLATSGAVDRRQYYPDRQGFDINVGGDNSGQPPTYFYPYRKGDRSLETMPPGGQDGEYLTDRLTDEAIKFMGASKDRPFLLYLAHYAVHTPLESKKALTQKYEAKAKSIPPAEGPHAQPVYGPYQTRLVQDNSVYAGMVQSVDESVGRVLGRLKELGLEDNTIVIFMSDNGGLSTVPREGPTCNLPLRAGKGWLYEGGIREPMIIKWPGVVRAGSLCHETVTSTDFYPTMLEMAGLPPKPGQHVDGVSLAGLLRGTGTLDRKAIYWHYPHYHGSGNRPSGAIRAGDYKLIEWYEDGKVELYNLKDDIGERNDLAATMPDKAGAAPDASGLAERDGSEDAGRGAPPRLQRVATSKGWKGWTMRRRDFLKTIAAGAALGLCGWDRAWGRQRRPNFVFFLIDDLGWTDLGCFGSPFYETPNIDRLAAQGMRFTNAYAACPVCSPTRASIMTGKYPARLRLTNYIPGARSGKLRSAEYFHYLKLEEVTLAEALHEAGYRTCFVGKWHLGNEPYYPEKQGFDVNVAGNDAGSPPTYFYPYKRGNRSIPSLEEGKPGEYLTDRLTDEALKLIEQSKDQPFLLYLSHYAVHIPLEAKKEMAERYKTKIQKLGLANKPHFAAEEDWPKTAAGDEKWRKTLKTRILQDHAVYAAMIESVDESVGRVMKKLDDLGLADDTIVFFMSDNGGLATAEGQPTCNLPLRGGKGWLYEGGIREPMMVRWPGATKPGSVCEEPAISTDFYPTMLEMVGLPPKPQQHVDGASLVPLLKGTGRPQRNAIYWHYPHYSNQGGKPGGAVRVGDFKLIEFYEDSHVELYNLRADLGERHDLAAEMPQKAAELRRRLHEWRQEVGAVMPEPNPDWKE